MGKVRISQTLIKEFEKANACPKRIKALYIEKTHLQEDTIAKLSGSYFESYTIGSMGNGSQILKLPRKKNGDPTVDNQRIDIQIQNFPLVMKKYGIEMPKPKSRQIEVVDEIDGWPVKIIIDFISSIDNPDYGKHDIVFFDLKLTKDRDNEFGDFCWGTPENIDHIQAWMYIYVFKKKFKDKLPEDFVPKWFYLIFDYKPQFGDKLVPVEYDAYYEERFLERFTFCTEKIEEAEKENWPARPDMELCKKCPLYKDKTCYEGQTADDIIGDVKLDDIW